MQKQRFELRVIRQYVTGDKYVRIFLQPVIRIAEAHDGFYIWLAKIFGLALLAESAMVALLFWTM